MEKPRRQSESILYRSFYSDQTAFELTAQANGFVYAELLRKAGINPDSVQTITELGSGIGVLTLGFLLSFPNTVIQVINYYRDELRGSISSDPRVKQHFGLFTEVLANNQLITPDVVVMISVSKTHGFHESNIGLLTNHVGSGLLVAGGENDYIEEKTWFNSAFERVISNEYTTDSVWQVK